MGIQSEHVLKPRNIKKIEERQKLPSSHHISTQHHAEIGQIIQQFGSRTENITTTNEWLKYQKNPEKSEILMNRVS